jgi:DNA-directed RNA polymerase subunit RPC12/RpoP
MSEFASFSPAQIEKLGLICKNCGTEIVVELEKDSAMPHRCPACQSNPEVPLSSPQPPFGYGTGWGWLKQIRELARSKEAPLVRFYFKEK